MKSFNYFKFSQFKITDPVSQGAEDFLSQDKSEDLLMPYSKSDITEDAEDADITEGTEDAEYIEDTDVTEDIDADIAEDTEVDENDDDNMLSVRLFENHVEMYDKLKELSLDGIKSSMDNSWNNYFSKYIGDTSIADDFKSGLSQFFSVDSDSEDAVEIANRLYDMYDSIYPTRSGKNTYSVSDNQEIDTASISTMDIVKMAKDFASSIVNSNSVKNKNAKFNLSKIAQHKGLSSSVILTGPSQTSLSPFSRDIQSGLHLIEQNKGFGLKIEDILDIDFEAIWRGNIMDKYNSPYRDKDGNYVGGYINRRFEVNRNIPVGNNLQLLPGTRHKPWMPEYSTVESRMQFARGGKESMSDPFSFSPLSISSFNLKKKSS